MSRRRSRCKSPACELYMFAALVVNQKQGKFKFLPTLMFNDAHACLAAEHRLLAKYGKKNIKIAVWNRENYRKISGGHGYGRKCRRYSTNMLTGSRHFPKGAKPW